jgi:oligopeptide transport system substrate-binding protein
MIRINKKIQLMLGLFSVGLLAACGNSNGGTSLDSAGANEVSSGNESASSEALRLTASADIPTMDIIAATDLVSFTAMNNAFEGLYTLDLNGKVVPASAKNMPEVSADGLVYTFTIRDDATWSNGEQVTSADYVYAWRKMVDPTMAAGYSYMYDGLIQNATEILAGEMDPAELAVEAISEKVLKVTLAQPAPYFLDLLSMPFFFPQNQAYVEEQGDSYGSSSDTLIYNGPFIMNDWNQSKGGSWTFTKNDSYWGKEEIALNQVVVQVMKETSTAINLYEADELDYAALSGEYVAANKANEDYHSQMNTTSNFIEMNQEIPALANENIREALTKSLDTANYTENVLKNGSVPIYGYVPNGLAANPVTGADFREDAGDLTNYNLEEAQTAWEKGLSELGVETISLELMTTDSEDSKKFAEFFQSQLQGNLPGLTITIRQVPFNVKQDSLRNGSFQLGTANWIADFADPVNYVERFHSDINRGNYAFDDVDTLIETAKAAYDDEEARWDLLVEAEQVAIGEHYVQLPTYQSAGAYLLKGHVKDLYIPVFGPDSYRYASIVE